MKILQLVSADGWNAVFDAAGEETEVCPVVAWALVEAAAGHQYLAPLVISETDCRHSDARDERLFIRVTRTGDVSPSKRAAHWFRGKERGAILCDCSSWDSRLCAGRSSTWNPDEPPCACRCHSNYFHS